MPCFHPYLQEFKIPDSESWLLVMPLSVIKLKLMYIAEGEIAFSEQAVCFLF